jgi:tetratricopeptide (TPR) repeat protein
VIATIATVSAIFWAMARESPGRLAARAEAEAARGDWPAALTLWRALNRTTSADGRSWMGEARACLALGRAAQAERALNQAIAHAPGDPEPWLIRLELIRLENRTLDAMRVGWAAYQAVPAGSRREVLSALTLALLTEPPADLARATLDRWIRADPADLDALAARLALDRRLGPDPDPTAAAPEDRIKTLARILEREPGHIAARETLVQTWLDLGEPDPARALLDAWPPSGRDARYQRLVGRLAQDFDRRPDLAAASYRQVLAALPHDWNTRYRLSLALQALNQNAEARQAAEQVAQLREILAPEPLGHVLNPALSHLDNPSSRRTLADLCARVGLSRLSHAWRLDGDSPASQRPNPPFGSLP